MENELNASMTVLAAVEAAFRIDFELRCRKNNTEPLSNRFRRVRHGRMQHTISFPQEILGIWEKEYPKSEEVIADLRKAFRFRNWLAHGRYWIPETGKIDYGDICALAESAFSALPREGLS
ncbi:MAG: hypothetical protein F4X92_10285 [Gammaproteobacteria bacterium]|nr:hypothetical protein [Gammaproteobacteria bacterium]